MVKTIQEPVVEPVTLQEVKDHLRVVHDEEDAIIRSYMQAARRYAETTFCWRAFMPQTLELVLDSFPPNAIKIPRPPLQEVTSIIYTDKGGTEHTVDPGDYIVDTDSEPGRIVPAYGERWPADILYPVSAVRVRYRAGYQASTGKVNVTNGAEDPFVNVSWVSGGKFDTDWGQNKRIVINGKVYSISSVTDDENLELNEDVGEELTGVSYVVDDVPEEIRQGILIMTAHLYAAREPIVTGTNVIEIPWSASALLGTYRAWGGEVV